MILVEEKIYKLCTELKLTSSTTIKKIILSRYKDDDDIRNFLKFLYDKTIVTGISKTRINKDMSKKCITTNEFETIFDIIELLKNNNSGADAIIVCCQNYLRSLNDRLPVEIADDVCATMSATITKSLKLGIDTKLVNTAIPNLIKVHEVQQALALKSNMLQDGEWFCMSEKLNGNRATYTNGMIISRQGKEFSNIQHIKDELDKLNSLMMNSFVFDGEIIRKNVDGVSDNTNFTLGTGILNSDVEDKTELSFVVFDMLPQVEFNRGESSLTYRARMETMINLSERIFELGFEHVKVVPFLYNGTDKSMIQKCLDEMDKQGKEGCMLARDVTYKCKRHNGLLKVKTFYTMDLEVVGMEAGSGKNENTLGNLIVKFKDNTVGVGSGFTDEQRNMIWSDKDSYIGKIAEVKYKDITRDKTTGKESLQFPVFVRFREEGKSVSYD